MNNTVRKIHISNSSFMKRLLLPILFLVVVQSVLFFGTLLFGGTVSQLDQNSFDLLGERVSGRKNYLMNEMIQRWTNLDDGLLNICNAAEKLADQHGLTPDELVKDKSLSQQLLSEVSSKMIDSLRTNSTTGIFLALGGEDTSQEGTLYRPGLYIRNPDPSSRAENNSDLMILHASVELSRKLNIPMDTDWTPQFEFGQQGGDFFNKPYQAALRYNGMEAQDLGYWSRPFYTAANGLQVVTYSIPLCGSDGKPFGVLGVEVTLDYLRKQLPYDELFGDKKGAYVLAVAYGNSLEFESILSSGSTATRYIDSRSGFSLDEYDKKQSLYTLSRNSRVDKSIFGNVQYLNIYNSNTPFENERWALIGIVEEEALLSTSAQVRTTMFFTLLLVLLIGIAGALFISKSLTNPLVRLVKEVRGSDPSAPVHFNKIKIAEVDELSAAIETLSQNVAASSSRLSQVIQMAGISIGAFDLNKEEGNLFCTANFFGILGVQNEEHKDGYVEIEPFIQVMTKFHKEVSHVLEDQDCYLYRVQNYDGQFRWVRLKTLEDESRSLGVVTDVTTEIMEKRKIEFERDYDLLTNLLNRRAFQTEMEKLFHTQSRLKIAALVMLDLDNLKYINDTYGHDYGDEYIRCTASVLRRFTPYRVVVARMSGDEFYLFLYGYESKEELNCTLTNIKNAIRDTVLPLPGDASGFKVRASAGVAWYPADSVSISELIKYADFAMYEVKNTVKGEFRNFNPETYSRDSYLLSSKEELNRLIDGELIEYHFQPIVDVRTGEIYAYEALMRSRSRTLKSPAEILTMARSQSKLGQIERMTWFRSLASFVDCPQISRSCKVFINSIPNQILSPEDIRKIEVIYSNYLERIVMELTEEEKLDAEFTRRKQDYVKKWHCQLAMDDYGTGYNGEAALLELSPDFVKIDMSIVRGIDKDDSRQQLFRNLVSYTRAHKIKVIAEGVETREEMETVIACGADYLQGYYLGRPSLEPIVNLEKSVFDELCSVWDKIEK